MRRRVGIVEQPDGRWRIECLVGFRSNNDVVLDTASDAFRLVRLQDEVDTLRFRMPYVSDVTWRVATGIGRRAVQEVTGEILVL